MKLTDRDINELILTSEKQLNEDFNELEQISLFNQEKVLNAFKKNKIALRHFNGSTGYGYGDDGRDALKRVYACVFNTEAALVSPNIVSGTHAIALGLFALLKCGKRALSVTGEPYDTLLDSIRGDNSIEEQGALFDWIDLDGSKFNYDKIADYIKNIKVDMLYIQRSRGYAEREALSINDIKDIIEFAKTNGFSGIVYVDNCYGEFVEKLEPTEVGADIVAGSLIKNMGGGIAPTGGYLAGKQTLIDIIEGRLTAPSICGEVGSYAYGYQYFYEGLFFAPHVVKEALKGSMLLGLVLENLGYETIPKGLKMPNDITRSVKMNNDKALISFIQSVQNVSPIDSFVKLEPWDMPGYKDKVIMAAGCFVQGASIELSADAPIRPPYLAYVQGGLTYEHSKIALKEILRNI